MAPHSSTAPWEFSLKRDSPSCRPGRWPMMVIICHHGFAHKRTYIGPSVLWVRPLCCG
jgi:hypothetical protein